MLDDSDQQSAIQLLIFMLPPCNSDTLQRLLCLLSTVCTHADDSLDSDGKEVRVTEIENDGKKFFFTQKDLYSIVLNPIFDFLGD